jgi:eukaryotic-like serine/threonine-protein kinase
MVGRTVGGKYRLVRLIGRGGVGAVYQAERTADGESLAIKILDPKWAKDGGVASRFAREARAISAVDSEHIVRVLDAGTHDGNAYIVMELLRGEDLGTRLQRCARLPAGESLHVTAQMLRGLAASHDAGIVHRDLKPDNVLLVEHAGDPNFAKIVDFGMSKAGRPTSGTLPMPLTRNGLVIGTPLYMAPEQARAMADVDGRADVFSVGAIWFECLTGRPPHVGESPEQILISVCTNDAPDVRSLAPEVPEAVARVIARALERDRARRYSSAREMLGALREIAPDDPATQPLATEAGSGPGVTGIDRGSSARARRRARARFIGAAVIATLAGAAATLLLLAMRR